MCKPTHATFSHDRDFRNVRTPRTLDERLDEVDAEVSTAMAKQAYSRSHKKRKEFIQGPRKRRTSKISLQSVQVGLTPDPIRAAKLEKLEKFRAKGAF